MNAPIDVDDAKWAKAITEFARLNAAIMPRRIELSLAPLKLLKGIAFQHQALAFVESINIEQAAAVMQIPVPQISEMDFQLQRFLLTMSMSGTGLTWREPAALRELGDLAGRRRLSAALVAIKQMNAKLSEDYIKQCLAHGIEPDLPQPKLP